MGVLDILKSKRKAAPKNKSQVKGKAFVPPKPATPAELRRRWKKKQGQVQTLANNMQKLRYNITSDLKSDDEKVFLTACVVSLMDKSAERVGNDDSASKGHRGITGLLKSQVNIEGNSIHLRYTGKSGVKQEKVVTDERLSNALRKAMGISTSKYLFCTSDGFKIKNDRVNRYLSDFGITAKDIRGFSANKWLIQKLHANDIADDEKQRKKDFIRMSKAVAAKVGHGHTMLKNQYLIPGLEEEYITNGRIMDIKDIDGFRSGGTVKKMESGGVVVDFADKLKGKKLNPDVRYEDGGITIDEENNDDAPESTIDMLKRYVEVSRNFDAFTRYLALSEEHEQQAVMNELRLEKATTSEIGMANKKKLEAFYKEQKKEINARRKERKFQVEQIKEQDFLEKITNMALHAEAQMQQNIRKYEERKKNAVRIPVSLFEDLPEDKSLSQDYRVPNNLFAD